jgi:micrococcal nuclease
MKLIIILLLTTYFVKAIEVDLIRVYDGDTIYVNVRDCNIDILCNDIGVRLSNIDTPELRTKCQKEKDLALIGKDFTINFIKDGFSIQDCKRDKFFRLNCRILNNKGEDLSEELIKNRLGVPYQGEKKVTDWCSF